MNRIIFLLALITYPVICIWANPIDKAEARLLAKECVGIDDTSDDNVPIAPYYVFSRGADKGFVIVSGDDTTAPILGYTEQGDFVWDELPDQLQQMLKAWGQAIGETQKAPRRVGPRRSVSERLESARRGVESFKEKWEDVAVMCQTHWHQSSPYNDLCPMNKEGTKRATTGCMATAASQIIYYFRKDNPAELQYDTPTYSYGFPVVESLPKGTPVEYDQMCLSGMGTAKQNHAVAVLMYAIGTSSYQTYGVSTGGQPNDCGKAMARQFLLNNDYRAKWNYTQQQWENLIYKSLKAGSPMLYGATAKDKSGSHAVVLDGYQAKTGLYHFNFGWGGSGDGWYTVDDENGMNGYPYDQRGCMNFRPCKPNLEAKMVLPEIIIHKKNEIRVKVVNNGTLPYKGIKFWVNSERELPKESTIENTDLVIPVDSTKEFVFTYRPASERRRYLFVTDSNNNILDSCTIFKDSFVGEDVIDSLNIDVTELYFTNAGFDEDLTFQTDGTTKPLISTNTSMSDRSWAYIAEDNTVYAKPKTTSSQSRPDGRKLDAVNGFIGQVSGWENVNNQMFPKCEWVYFGTIPYDLENQAIPITDDGSTYLEVPSRPAIASGEDNVGFAYFRAGWGGRAVYKKTVKLPCAKYRLEYWAINVNPNAKNGKNLSKVICGRDTLEDETGFNNTDWTKHEIEFTPITDTVIELGFESSAGSGSNPFLCIDGIKIVKITNADEIAIMLEDCYNYLEELSNLEIEFVSQKGLYDEIDSVYFSLIDRINNNNIEVICVLLQEIKDFVAKYERTKENVTVLKELIAKANELVNETDYPGKVSFEIAIEKATKMLNTGSSAEIEDALNEMKKAIDDYKGSMIITLDYALAPLFIGKNGSMNLCLSNENELIAFEFDMQLPDGITIAKDEDNDPMATLSSRASKHLLAVSDKGNGLYHFLCYSAENKSFSGNEGVLLRIELLCNENISVGTYQATVKNIIFSDVDKNKITLADYTFDLEVIDAVPGDVNNDGEINVMDVVEMVAYIMGDGAEGFVLAAADLYPDGAINVMDLVNLVDLIMNSSASNAREWTDNSMSLSTLADGVVSVKVNNPEQYVASEFIVEVSAGQTLETVTADKRHRVTCSQLDDSHYKVMAYSSANSTFNSDALVQLHISGEGMVNVHDALLVDESRKGVAFAPAVGGYTTGINQMENGKLIIENSSVYDLQGKKRDTSRPYMHEVLIVNGKKQMVR